MNRFQQYAFQWLEKLHILGDAVVLEWGHYTTKLAANGVLLAEERSLAIVDEQQNYVVAIGQRALEKKAWQLEQFREFQLVHNHLPTHIGYAAGFLALLIRRLQTEKRLKPGLVKGVCALPSKSTILERQLVQRVLAQSQTGKWSVLDAPQVALRVAQHYQLLQKVGGILELGAQTSELILLLPNGQAVGTTIPFGAGMYGVLLQRHLRENHGVVVGELAAQETIKQWGHSVLGEAGQTVVAIRAKALTTGKPTTIRFVLEELSPQFEATTAACLNEVQAFFAKRSASDLERVMEAGLVVMGGGAHLSGLVRYLQAKLCLPLHSVLQPSSFLIARFSKLQQQAAYEI